MMNHQCLPNVRYNFDDRRIMIVQAAKEIKEGEEISTSYLQLLWSTLTRRLQLKATKDFMCSCPRCVDPTENGSYISAIKCAKPDCTTGRLLPVNPLVVSSPWQCDVCALKLEFKKISRILDVLSSVILKLKDKGLRNMQEFLKNTVPDILPVNNEFALELKLFVIWRVGKESSEKRGRKGREYFKYLLLIKLIILQNLWTRITGRRSNTAWTFSQCWRNWELANAQSKDSFSLSYTNRGRP